MPMEVPAESNPPEGLHAGGTVTGVPAQTPGTLVAEVEADSGKAIRSFRVSAGASNAAGTSAELVVTFEDDSTETFAIAQGTAYHISRAGGVRYGSGAESTVPTLFTDQTSAIKKLRVQTVGTGNSNRWAIIEAVQA